MNETNPPAVAVATTPPNNSTLSRALERLRNLGVTPGKVAMVPAIAVINELQVVEIERPTHLARVFQAEADFNEMARGQTQGMIVGTAHEKIARDFDTIVEDTRAYYTHLSDGKLSVMEKFDITKRTLLHGGTIPSRFNNVREQYLEATKRCQEQLNQESNVIEAYGIFRLAYTEAIVDALELQKLCLQQLDQAKSSGQAALAAWEAEKDEIAKAKLAVEKAKAVEAVEKADRRYQVATNLVNDMRVGTGAGDTVIDKLKQTHKAKQAIQDRAITFWATNEHVITALCVALQSQKGLHERTQSVQALERGTEKAMDVLAEIGTKVDRQAIETAHGESLKPEVIQRLVDSMVNYQKETIGLIAECRKKADESSKAIMASAEAGQREIAKLVLQ